MVHLSLVGSATEEIKPLRKNKNYLPDVYPQSFRQKEDELSAETVRNGLQYRLADGIQEYEGLRVLSSELDELNSDFVEFLKNSIHKKDENVLINDLHKLKKFQANAKDMFWPAARSISLCKSWFSDLAKSNQLAKLARKVPTFLKKDEIFLNLFEVRVPIQKAVWYIKVHAAYSAFSIDQKSKKRQVYDACLDWTKFCTEYLKETLDNINRSIISKCNNDYMSLSLSDTGHLLANPDLATLKKYIDIWEYSAKIVLEMNRQLLLDRQLLLEWLVDVAISGLKSNRLFTTKLIFSLVIQLLNFIVESELLARKLAFYCCQKISEMIRSMRQFYMSQQNDGDLLPSESIANQSSLNHLSSCHYHGFLFDMLCFILQSICLKCPFALIWSGVEVTDVSAENPLAGSPLDKLFCLPSQLPLPVQVGHNEDRLHERIRAIEEEIRARSLAMELRWSTDKLEENISGAMVNKLLFITECLDEYFDNVKIAEECLYDKIFGWAVKESLSVQNEWMMIHLLCEWAVIPERFGVHRSFLIASLLERRKAALDHETSLDTDKFESRLADVVQNALSDFLENRSIVIISGCCNESVRNVVFSTLMMLFALLIHRKVFSYDRFIRSLYTSEKISIAKLEGISRFFNSNNTETNGCVFNTSEDFGSGTSATDASAFVEIDNSIKVLLSDETPAEKIGFITQNIPIPRGKAYFNERNQRIVTLYGFGEKSVECPNKSQEQLMNLTELQENLAKNLEKLTFHDRYMFMEIASDSILLPLKDIKSSYFPAIENVLFVFDLMERFFCIHHLLKLAVALFNTSLSFEKTNVITLCIGKLEYFKELNRAVLAIFRMFLSSLLHLRPVTMNLFDSLCRMIENSSVFMSHNVVHLIYELYGRCVFLREHFRDRFLGLCTKIKANICSLPFGSLSLPSSFVQEEIQNFLRSSTIEYQCNFLKNIHDVGSFSYLLYQVTCAILHSNSIEKATKLIIATTKIQCTHFLPFWRDILHTILSNEETDFLFSTDLLANVKYDDSKMKINLALLLILLLTHDCISLNDICIIFLQSVLSICSRDKSVIKVTLVCYLLRLLFNLPMENGFICSTDRRLLLSLFNTLSFSQFLMVFKALVLLSSHDYNEENSNDVIRSEAHTTLNFLCSLKWFREWCFKDNLFAPTGLCDKLLTEYEAQDLLRRICYLQHDAAQNPEEFSLKETVNHIFTQLNLWTMRSSYAELNLLLKQREHRTHLYETLLDTIARAAVDTFQTQLDNCSLKTFDLNTGLWFLAPLISKMSTAVQNRVLKFASNVLENGNQLLSLKNRFEKESSTVFRSTSLLGQQPFLMLVLSCLNDQSEQKENLLSSLKTQLEQFLNQCEVISEDVHQIMLDSLQLRLSLVGGMFDNIQKNNTATAEWAVLFAQLIMCGLINEERCPNLYKIVVDMFCSLIHVAYDIDTKMYYNIARKIRKEMIDENSSVFSEVLMMLPFSKGFTEVCVVESVEPTKCSKDEIKSVDFQLSHMEKLSNWELIEGVKNPSPLCLSWFCALRLENKVLKYEKEMKNLFVHNHSFMFKNSDYYTMKPNLPVNAFDMEDDKIEKSGSSEKSKSSTERKRGGSRKRRQARNTGSQAASQPSCLLSSNNMFTPRMDCTGRSWVPYSGSQNMVNLMGQTYGTGSHLMPSRSMHPSRFIPRGPSNYVCMSNPADTSRHMMIPPVKRRYDQTFYSGIPSYQSGMMPPINERLGNYPQNLYSGQHLSASNYTPNVSSCMPPGGVLTAHQNASISPQCFPRRHLHAHLSSSNPVSNAFSAQMDGAMSQFNSGQIGHQLNQMNMTSQNWQRQADLYGMQHTGQPNHTQINNQLLMGRRVCPNTNYDRLTNPSQYGQFPPSF